MLVADEAGLGKTTVAAEAIRRVKEQLPHEVFDDDGLYTIVYVCCNLQIAKQNIDDLYDDGEKVNLSESRLSMQHYVYYKKKAELKSKGKDTLVMSLTPATSFQMSCGIGSVDERALMFACLSLLPHFQSQEQLHKLSSLLVGWAPKTWKWMSAYYYNSVRQPDMDEYRHEIEKAMRVHLSQTDKDGNILMQRLVCLCNAKQDKQWETDSYNIIVDLRKVFADISLQFLRPDMVVMDEFQKFSTLLDAEKAVETEENKIARKFFSNKDTYILLLSATPYKPYTTLEELNDSNNDEQYRDFHKLMDFLHVDGKDDVTFKTVWRDYSDALKQIEHDNSIIAKHDAVENKLYQVMGRTERLNEGIIHEEIPTLDDYLTDGDILSFVQMQHLVDKCRKLGQRIYSAPVDYAKSSAFQLSFMDNYKLKDYICEAWKAGAGRGMKTDCILLDMKAIENYTLENYRNAKLNFVVDTIFGKGKQSTGVESLLWIPASHPYYTQKPNVFTKNETFSKYLVFSSWGMVPKMLACLLSYETERRLYRRSNETYRKKDYQPLRDSADAVLTTVSEHLADIYHPEKCYGQPLDTIKRNIRKKVSIILKKSKGVEVKRVSSSDLHLLLLAFGDQKTAVGNIPKNAVDVFTDIAIGSPALCLYRVFKRLGDKDAKLHAEEVAKEFIKVFNNRQGVAAVRKNCRTHSNYLQKVVDYCIQGNLQSVLDEFVHMIGERKAPEDIVERMKESFVQAYPQPVNTTQTFNKGIKDSMRKHFAVDLGSGKQTEKDARRATHMRSAFNSPFRPFVLASTSVGQEGLDFHWYCRKMIHWNLPSNPQDLEQREGRINRFKCLSVRRNIAKLYPDTFEWNDMFSRASSELKGNHSEMVPFWYLPLKDKHFESIATERIERIVPMFPMSEDESRYSRLIKVLSLYRLTMGQPRQEELLQMLDGKISQKLIKKLLFDLSPFNRRNQRRE